MRAFLVIDDLIDPGPVFLGTVWPFAAVMKDMLSAEHLYIPHQRQKGRSRVFREVLNYTEAALLWRSWRRTVRARLDPDGPNILFVCAFSRRSVNLSRALYPIWHLFDKRVLMIEENIEPGSLPPGTIKRFDLVSVYCRDLGERYRAKFDIEPVFLPPHTDVLRFHSTADYRPIDMAVVGRRQNKLHGPLFRHYSAPDSRRLFVDFITRTPLKQSLEEEFGLLCSTYGRSKIAFCYEPRDVPRFRGRSPLLVRWVHAWAAGCTVAGSRPKGTGAAEEMDWPDSMFDLPEDPSDAVDLMENLLDDDAGLVKRRWRNVAEALGRHDSRLRLKLILDELGLPIPNSLARGLADLSSLRDRILLGRPDA